MCWSNHLKPDTQFHEVKQKKGLYWAIHFWTQDLALKGKGWDLKQTCGQHFRFETCNIYKIWAMRLPRKHRHPDHRKSSHGRMHYGIRVIHTTVLHLLKDEQILYHWCESMSSHGPKSKSFDVCQHRQNQSRSPKTIRQPSQRITPPPSYLIWTSNNMMLD